MANDDFPIRLAEVPRLIYDLTGERVNFKSVYRWATRGKRGIRLDTLAGIRVRTTRAMVLRFLARLGGNEKTAPPQVVKGKRRQQTAKAKALAAAGR